MTEEEKKAVEYLKTRLYGNEGCKYIDVAQEDLRIFINLIDRREKEIKNWKKYSEELEKEKLEISNKECELEFDIEKLQKENEELAIKIDDKETEIQILKDDIKADEIEYKNVMENLKKENEKLNEKILSNTGIYELGFRDGEKRYIQKITDKIDELQQEIENLPAEAYPITEDDLQIKIEALEELFKED